MDFSSVVWRKSSRSTNNGACVEVGTWRKSSRSTNNGSCVEVGMHDRHGVAVRDSKDPDGPKLAFSADGWRAFTERVRGGSLDLSARNQFASAMRQPS